MKKRFLSVIISLVLVMMLLSSNIFTLTAAAANLYFDYESLSSPFVVGEQFRTSCAFRTASWALGSDADRKVLSQYAHLPDESYTSCTFQAKAPGRATMRVTDYKSEYLVAEVIAVTAKVAVNSEYTVTGSEGTDHKWSIHSSNLNNGKRSPQRGLADLVSFSGNTAVVMPTAVGNIVIDHQYVPKDSKDAKTEYIAICGTKGTPTCTIPENIETVDGQTLANIDLPQPDSNGRWSWDEKANPLSTKIEIGGKTSAVAKFSPKNTTDYNEVTATVEFLITVAQEEGVVPNAITYYKWDANSKTLVKANVKQDDVLVLTPTDDALTLGKANTSTWYYTYGNVIINTRVKLLGNVNLILADESCTSITNGIEGDGKSSLTVYSTSTGDKQGSLVVTTPNGTNGKHYYENGGCSTGGKASSNAGSFGALTLNGGNVQFLPGNGGYGGEGGKTSVGGGWYIDSPGASGANGGNALVLNTLTINGGNLRAIGGNGGDGGKRNYSVCGSGGNAGYGVCFNKDGKFNVSVASDYNGTIYIASGIAGKVGGGTNSYNGSAGTQVMATNVSFKDASGLIVYTSDEDIVVDDKGNVSGTKLAADTLTEMSAHRYLYAFGNPVSKDKASDNATGSMKSGGNPIIFIIIAVVVVAAAVAFVVIRKNKKAEVTEKVNDAADTVNNNDNE